jgi:hypothetical protein
MNFSPLRSFLLERGIVYLYALFVAGYFLLPSASGHRRLYYILVLPTVCLLWREIAAFYRGNKLAGLLFAYAAYMMLTVAWSQDFALAEAGWALWYTVNLLSFCLLSGYLWINYPQLIDRLARRAVWLAAAAASVSLIAWYLQHPFPSSRLVPLGVMHHENKAACAYGIFALLAVHYLLTETDKQRRLRYLLPAVILLSLVLLTQSRTALAAVSAGLLILAGYRALLLVAVGSAASWALLAANPKGWWHRVEELSFRPAIWKQVLSEPWNNWLMGRGYLLDTHVEAGQKVFNHAHNSYIATWRDGGLLGLLLLLALLATALLWGWRLQVERGERLYLALMLYGMTSITMDFDRLLTHPKELWLFFWLPLALIMACYTHRNAAGAARYPAWRQ